MICYLIWITLNAAIGFQQFWVSSGTVPTGAFMSSVPTFSLVLCTHWSSDPTDPLVLCTHWSSVPTGPLYPLVLCSHCSSGPLCPLFHWSSVPTIPLFPLFLWSSVLTGPLCPLFTDPLYPLTLPFCYIYQLIISYFRTRYMRDYPTSFTGQPPKTLYTPKTDFENLIFSLKTMKRGKCLQLQQNASVSNASPVCLGKFRWIFDPVRMGSRYWPHKFDVA